MPKNVPCVLPRRLFCVKDSYNFNMNKHFDTLFFILVAFYYPTHTIKPYSPVLVLRLRNKERENWVELQ